jgi:hypothetical protein
MSPRTGFHRDFLLYHAGLGSTVELLVLLALDEACTLHTDKLGGHTAPECGSPHA